ncbi:hypothetical protein SKAU_G00104920 [Synaphobranchus kaupii]|uniref:Uncharacterized protein n=1 Tax=Synaphobranchus kaupii TaxID=118154 RepID=A0A9Q1FYZ1_SYNKA|nr:hypothetical protein SKAU_G00104920 [Synaphobranchus kaupii]
MREAVMGGGREAGSMQSAEQLEPPIKIASSEALTTPGLFLCLTAPLVPLRVLWLSGHSVRLLCGVLSPKQLTARPALDAQTHQ